MNRLAMTLAALAVALASVAVAAASDEDAARESALAIYEERCGVEPGSARSRFARSDWGHLRADGWSAADLRDIAEEIPEDCEYISFKMAILAVGREMDHPAAPPESRVVLAPYVPPPHGSREWWDEIGLERPFRGLPRRHHAGWVVGVFHAGLAGAGLVEAVAMFFAVGAAGDNVWSGAFYALLALPGLACFAIGGTVALIAAATVESYRVQSSSAIDRERRRRTGAELRAGPGVLFVRF